MRNAFPVRRCALAALVVSTAIPLLVGGSTSPAAAATIVPSPACIGTGSDGARVQVVYARASDVADRSALAQNQIRAMALSADNVLNASAAESSNKSQHIRFVTNSGSPGCQVMVRNLVLSPSGDDSFANLKTELHAAGGEFNRQDRKYLVFADAASGAHRSDVWPGNETVTSPTQTSTTTWLVVRPARTSTRPTRTREAPPASGWCRWCGTSAGTRARSPSTSWDIPSACSDIPPRATTSWPTRLRR